MCLRFDQHHTGFHMKSIIVFGLGHLFQEFLKRYDAEKINILALCDNDKKLIGNIINGITVISPDELRKYDFDYLVITGKYSAQIKAQVVELIDIAQENILEFSQIQDFLQHDIRGELIRESARALLGYHLLEERMNTLSDALVQNQEKSMILNAKNLILQNQHKKIESLSEVEFKVFSQNGEDGIIQWMIHNVEIENRVFIEFGVEDYQESNTRFLLMNDNWSGFVIDGSSTNIEAIKRREYYWRYDLKALSSFITKDNISHLIRDAGISGNIGILSIDIDGNDYWVLDSIECVSPTILICEYNSTFGSDKAVTVPYDESFRRNQKHFSNLYYGASLKAFCNWAQSRDYIFLGCNSAGNNAFFVKRSCIKEDKIPSKAEYVEARFAESRDSRGNLTFLRGKDKLREIQNMEVYEIQQERNRIISELFEEI